MKEIQIEIPIESLLNDKVKQELCLDKMNDKEKNVVLKAVSIIIQKKQESILELLIKTY